MKRAILAATLILGSMSFAEAMEITKVKKKYISIEDRQQDIDLDVSDVISLVDNNGAVVGEARILKVKGNKAKAYLMDGTARKGFRAAEKGDEDSIDSGSPYNRGQSISKSRQFKGFNTAPKRSFGLETGFLRTATGILNVKGHMALANGMTLGAGLYSYDVTDDLSTLTVTGETIALIGTKYFNNRAFSQGAYTRLEVGMVSLSVESQDYYSAIDLNGVEVSGDVSGVHARANMGYQWQWSSFYTQAYAGLQYISLSADEVSVDGETYGTQTAEASATAFDLGFNMGVAF